MAEIIKDDLGLDLGAYLAEWEAGAGNEAAAPHMAWLVKEFPLRSAHGADRYVLVENWINGPAPARVLGNALSSPAQADGSITNGEAGRS